MTMERAAVLPRTALLLLIQLTLSQAYFFQEGFVHHYTYSSETDLLGKKNVTTVLKFEIRNVNTTEDGGRLHALHVNSMVQFADGGFYQDNPKGWDLHKDFLFHTHESGCIVLVHIDPEEKEELVVIKKAMASILSVTVKQMNETTFQYEETELDHLGSLPHSYEVTQTSTTRTISRTHFSHERAQRTHEKTLHYDEYGTLQRGEAFDKILLKQKRIHLEKPRPLMPGEKEHKIETSGEFPEIWTSSRTHIKLDGKRTETTRTDQLHYNGLIKTTLLIQPKQIRRRLHEVSANISRYLQCVHDHPEKGDANRTDCVHSIRGILHSLHPEDYVKFGTDVLNTTCGNSSSRCSTERLLFIDVIARIADDASQSLIVDHVLNRDPDEEELRHIFIQCIGIEKPIRGVVTAVESYCTGSNNELHGSIWLTATQRRACLAIGSLARSLHLNSNHSEATRLVDIIDDWITKHENHPSYRRKKRSVSFAQDHDYITTKAVLLHSLGNAAHPKSLDRIVSLTAHHQGHHVWRRAAVGALRHYTCNKSANALLTSALKDHKDSVRQAARHAYVKHPLGGSVTQEQEDIILSHQYTWPVVARLKRSLLDMVIFQYNISLPPFDWKKVIGTPDIGASFGVQFENRLSAVFRPLSGFVDISIYDKLWAEVHLGIVNLHVDILLIEICYKGKLEYNINKFKDFSVGSMDNIVGAFDVMAKEIMKPITDTANRTAQQFLAGDGKSSKSIFDPLANAVKDIPLKTSASLNVTIELNELLQQYKSQPWISRLKQVADRAQSLMEGVNADALGFYKKVSDAAVVALPFAEKEIIDSINRANGLMSQISEFPKQAFGELEKSRLSFQLGMQRIFSSNNIIREATSLLKGQSSSWMSAPREITDVVSSLKGILASATKRRERKKREVSSFDQVNDVLEKVGDSSTEIFDKVQNQITKVISKMEEVRDKAPASLQDGIDKQKQATDMLQRSFEAFQKAIEKTKSVIQSLFGSKFHPDFPRHIRPRDQSCGTGNYPAGTLTKYKTKGIDIVLEKNLKVVCPVAGLVRKSGDNEVTIEPSDADFEQYEIIIANIEPSVGNEKKHLSQGVDIGKSAGQNGCKWSHLHLAVKKRSGTNESCFYMNPRSFVNTLKMKPVWQKECKDFTFKYIGNIFDTETFNEKLNEMANNLKRAAFDWVADLAIKTLDKLIAPNSQFGELSGFLKGIIGNLGVLSDVTDLFTGVGSEMKNFFSSINIKKMDFKALSDILGASDSLKRQLPKLRSLLGGATKILKEITIGQIKSYALGRIGKHLMRFGIFALGGKLTSLVQMKTTIYKVCPHFQGGFPFGYDQMCTAYEDCLGFTCDIKIPVSSIKAEVSLKVRIHPTEAKVNVSLNDNDHLIPEGNAITKTGVKLGPITFSLKSSAQWRGETVNLSLYLTPCLSTTCLSKFLVVKDLKINRNHESDIGSNILKNFDIDMEKLDLSSITDQLANLNLPTEEFIGQMNGMMDGIRSKISEHMEDPVGSFKKELEAEDEYRDTEDHPNGSPTYFPFFEAEFAYGYGPFVFVISFSAGGELGTDITTDLQAVNSTVDTRVAPFVAGRCKASMAISIIIASAGISLDGWLLKTQFPFILELNFAKIPTTETKRLQVKLNPLEFRLRAFVKLLFFIDIKFDIWHWTSTPLIGTIWEKKKEHRVDKPPRFPDCDNRAMSVSGSCSIKQLSGRHPSDTAFLLEVDSTDDKSPLRLDYSIGTSRGGRDVRSLVEMRGSTLTVPSTSLPNGVPLYWTVRARNTEDIAATVSCMLPTFDNTLPDGRVEPAYQFTSHRTKIQANVVVFEDSQLQESHRVAVGYSPGTFGKEVVEWQPLILNKIGSRQEQSSVLQYFTPPQHGKLTSTPFSTSNVDNDVACARQCLNSGLKCVSFDFAMHSQTCDLQQTVLGPNTNLHTTGSYFHYERLGVGYSALVEYSSLKLEHGAQYFVNAEITNVLNYTAYLPSAGTLADFTPPEPGPVGEAASDILVADGCKAAVTQRCIDVNMELNHRKVTDGMESKTIFNGNIPLVDKKWTLANNFISGNCDGFHDDESGIWGYTWAAGTTVCGADVVAFSDPHANLQTREDWTYTGLGKNLHLSDGPYYITFQAINNVVHGGALVTTVCHSQPLTVDTTPPLMNEVGDLLFDEDFDVLGVYFNVSDEESGISRVDFGLGKTKYDVFVRSYSRHHFMARHDPYLVIEDLGLAPGIQAWVRIRAVNNVNLFAAGHGDVPILIDFTAPVAGQVLDGGKIHQDIDFQHDTTSICAQWVSFYDPESGIDSFRWGVGTTAGKDDVIPFLNFTHREKFSCHEVTLRHNTTYYSTVVAVNGALKHKEVEGVSNGVLIDITPPLKGFVQDGPIFLKDVDFSSTTATIQSVWYNFTDPESHVSQYSVAIFINEELKKVIPTGPESTLTDHTLSIKHLDQVRVEVTATNGAGLEVQAGSDGYLVDQTPPSLVFLSDSMSGLYQNDDSRLFLQWHFKDDESGIQNYRYTIYQTIAGQKEKFWPDDKDNEVINRQKANITLDELQLVNGAIYSVLVTAINKAMLASEIESNGVIVDVTYPTLRQVLISFPGEEEEIGEDGNVLHIEGEPLHVSWSARDPESGTKNNFICINDGVTLCDRDEQFVDYGLTTTVTLHTTTLVADTDSLYRVHVTVVNGVGLSAKAASKGIVVQKGNTAGTVYDGRRLNEDSNFQQDTSSLSMSFSGFSSEVCSITGYEWGIGTKPFATDIMRFTNFGLSILDDGKGYAEISNSNFDNVHFYSTVRAITGENCHESYIVASSDGITVDRELPDIKMYYKDLEMLAESRYQNHTNSLPISWVISDESGLESQSWTVSNLPGLGVKHFVDSGTAQLIPADFTPSENKTYVVTVFAKDKPGNVGNMFSVPITIDNSPAVINNIRCTPFISQMKSIVSCNWMSPEEKESKIKLIKISTGSYQEGEDIARTIVSVYDLTWTYDFVNVLTDSDMVKDLYLTFIVLNEADMKTRIIRRVTIDSTTPHCGSVAAVTSGIETSCQIQSSYIKTRFDEFTDNESGIERYQLAIGSQQGLTDVHPFTDVDVNEGFGTLTNLNLIPRSLYYLTAKVFNNAGLYTIQKGGSVAITPEPYLTVIDGAGDEDSDSQHHLSVIQGRWVYSDPCPVLSAEWAVVDISGNIIKDFNHTPGDGPKFYNDELLLRNMITYYVKVKVVDGLNRTVLSSSNGITVKIQPPVPGHVRDGFGRDINFQLHTDYLAANWDPFDKDDPSQHIIYYEVAVGDDRRYYETRSNIHYFENVGLNTSYVFRHLDLTSKTKTYFVSVRAHNAAGGTGEAFSNGIRVGYKTTILPGDISVNSFQSSTTEIRASWSDFVSDFEIASYQVHVAANVNLYGIKDRRSECEGNGFNSLTQFTSVGVNTSTKIDGLTLVAGETYYVLLRTEDEAGNCIITASAGITIDETPPNIGYISVENETGHIMYTRVTTELHILIHGSQDKESEIDHYSVQLLEGPSCLISSHKTQIQDLNNLRIVEVYSNDVHLNNLILEETTSHYIRVTAVNKAKLSSQKISQAILSDVSPPVAGTIKAGVNWEKNSGYWSDLNAITGSIALHLQPGETKCDSQKSFDFTHLTVLDDKFHRHAVIKNKDYVQIFARLDQSKTLFEKGGVSTGKAEFVPGYYSVTLQAVADKHISTAFLIAKNTFPRPENIFKEFRKVFIENCTESECEETFPPYLDGSWSIGILFTEDNETSLPTILFWGQDESALQVNSIDVDFDPTSSSHEYIIQVNNRSAGSMNEWHVDLIIDGELKGQIEGLRISGNAEIVVYTWNNYGYIPQVDDPFNSYSKDVMFTSLKVPKTSKTACQYGKIFSDISSGIKDVFIGLSDSQKVTGNVSPYTIYKTFCIPCNKNCIINCEFENVCNEQEMSEIVLENFRIGNLSLKTSTMNDKTNYTDTTASAYYIDVKVSDHAGYTTEAKSEAIIIDTTPPLITDVTCFDPEHSLYTPASFLGNDHTVIASWTTSEDFSYISIVLVGLGNSCGIDNIIPSKQSRYDNITLTLTKTKFQDDTEYHVSVTAVNSAGLNQTRCCNFTTDFKTAQNPPNKPKALFLNGDIVPGLDVRFSEFSDRIGIEWGDPVGDVDYFEWDVENEIENSKIYPEIGVWFKSSRSVKVIMGQIYLEDTPGTVSASMAEYLNRNISDGLVNEPLSLEPGKCTTQTVTSVTRAHKKTKMFSAKTCIKRKKDILLQPGATTEVVMDARQPHIVVNNSRDDIPAITVKISQGALIIGSLNKSDVEKSYGAQAAVDYSPYIVNPHGQLSSNQTSRFLRERLIRYEGEPFFLSPVTDVHLEEDIDLRLPATGYSVPENGQELGVIFWDAYEGKWRHVVEVCTQQSVVWIGSTNFKICNNIFKPVSKVHIKDKRKTTIFPSPRMFSAAILTRYLMNTHPVIDTSNITCLEDQQTTLKVLYHDAEDDKATFTIATAPRHGHAKITSDGNLFYQPFEDYNRQDILVLEVTEVFEHDLGVMPARFTVSISIDITSVNDQPASFFQKSDLTLVPSSIQAVHNIYYEANTTDHAVGAFWFADKDSGDSLTILKKEVSGGSTNFSFTSIPEYERYEIYENLTKIYDANSVSGFNLRLHLAPDYHGNINFSVLAVDTMKSYSHQLGVSVYVLISPCIHGECSPASSLPCQHPTRSVTFDHYTCLCEPGYKGTYCEDEINECACTPLYDCEEKLARYDCILNIPKVFAIILCILLPIAGILFFLRRRQGRYNVEKSRYVPEFHFNPVYNPEPEVVQNGTLATANNMKNLLRSTQRAKAYALPNCNINPDEESKPNVEEIGKHQDTGIGFSDIHVGLRKTFFPMSRRKYRGNTMDLLQKDKELPRVVS